MLVVLRVCQRGSVFVDVAFVGELPSEQSMYAETVHAKSRAKYRASLENEDDCIDCADLDECSIERAREDQVLMRVT